MDGSTDLDPYQNVTDPEHWLSGGTGTWQMSCAMGRIMMLQTEATVAGDEK